MSHLLDTHVWIWSLLEPERLGKRVARLLASDQSELWLSSISVWELLVLLEKQRLVIEGDRDAWIDAALSRAPIREAPITHEIARESRRIDLPHPDPADRFLAATAQVLELTLITADARLLAAPGLKTLAVK